MPIRMLFIAIVCLARAGAQAPLDPKIADMVSKTLAEFKAPSVSVAIVHEGAIQASAFGKADIDTRYAVGSISKQFTVAAILLLAEQGKLSLDDHVSKWFPELTRANDVTLRQLLSHTSGYSDYAPQDYIIPEWTHPTTPEAVIHQWAVKPLDFDPGTKWQYSNTNFVLAGLIFEKASGLKLKDFLRDNIFSPLGMASAGYCDPNGPHDAQPYTRFALGPPRPVAREGAGWYFADGDLCMTPTDLAKWDVAFLQKKILSPQSYSEFTREAMLANGDSTGYALGLTSGYFHRIPEISHGGEVSGFLALNEVFPTRQAAVVVLTNEDGVGLSSSVADKIDSAILLPTTEAAPDTTAPEVTAILTGLQKGTIDRGKLTANASAYFTAQSLGDIRDSLKRLGKLKTVVRTRESLRGGMIHRSYKAEFAKKTLNLNIYVLPGGKYEQFLLEE